MKITDALLGEHGVLYQLLDYCADEAQGWDETTVEAMAGALESHSKIEDQFLFQVLEPFFPSGQGPLAAMRAEHDEIDGSMERVLASTDLEERRALLKRISELAREHFAKEEQVLFPMAEQRLGVARLEEIGERWAEERNVVLGTPIPFGGPVA